MLKRYKKKIWTMATIASTMTTMDWNNKLSLTLIPRVPGPSWSRYWLGMVLIPRIMPLTASWTWIPYCLWPKARCLRWFIRISKMNLNSWSRIPTGMLCLQSVWCVLCSWQSFLLAERMPLVLSTPSPTTLIQQWIPAWLLVRWSIIWTARSLLMVDLTMLWLVSAPLVVVYPHHTAWLITLAPYTW